jgi:hypothetical protein
MLTIEAISSRAPRGQPLDAGGHGDQPGEARAQAGQNTRSGWQATGELDKSVGGKRHIL